MRTLGRITQGLVEQVAHYLLLDQVIECAARYGLRAELFFSTADQHHDRNVACRGLHSQEGREADAVSQCKVEEDDTDAADLQPCKCISERGSDFERVALALDLGQLLADHPLIIWARVD